VSFTVSSNRGAVSDGPRRPAGGRTLRGTRIHPGAAVGVSGVLAAAVALTLAPAAGASTSSAAAHHPSAAIALHLRAMPRGTVTFGRRRGLLTVRAVMSGLTAGSSHAVILQVPGRARAVQFSTVTASSAGQASSTLHSNFAGHLATGSRLLVRMGTGSSGVAREPIAVTGRLSHPGGGAHRLTAVEVTRRGISYGTPKGRASISYQARRHTLTVTVSASGVTPGPHAAHIHLGSCMSQGPVRYMLGDLVANHQGRIIHAVRVITNVTAPVPASGWYLNIHQGNTGDILSNGQPTILFRPLLCADIRGTGTDTSILRADGIVAGDA
jgi:CHRD domain